MWFHLPSLLRWINLTDHAIIVKHIRNHRQQQELPDNRLPEWVHFQTLFGYKSFEISHFLTNKGDSVRFI